VQVPVSSGDMGERRGGSGEGGGGGEGREWERGYNDPIHVSTVHASTHVFSHRGIDKHQKSKVAAASCRDLSLSLEQVCVRERACERKKTKDRVRE